MKLEDTRISMKRVVLKVLFVAGPAMSLSVYAVYLLRDWLAVSGILELPNVIYILILVFVMWASMRLTVGSMLDEVIKEEMKNKQEK
jgi:uncharacterized membrane protein YqjE